MRYAIFTDIHANLEALEAVLAAFDISEAHLNKVVHFLGQRGWLVNVRGKGGGIELGKPAHLIRVGAVVRQTEGTDLPAECFSEQREVRDSCAIARGCQLKAALGEAVAAFYEALDQYTLAEICENRSTLSRLLLID